MDQRPCVVTVGNRWTLWRCRTNCPCAGVPGQRVMDILSTVQTKPVKARYRETNTELGDERTNSN